MRYEQREYYFSIRIVPVGSFLPLKVVNSITLVDQFEHTIGKIYNLVSQLFDCLLAIQKSISSSKKYITTCVNIGIFIVTLLHRIQCFVVARQLILLYLWLFSVVGCGRNFLLKSDIRTLRSNLSYDTYSLRYQFSNMLFM